MSIFKKKKIEEPKEMDEAPSRILVTLGGGLGGYTIVHLSRIVECENFLKTLKVIPLQKIVFDYNNPDSIEYEPIGILYRKKDKVRE